MAEKLRKQMTGKIAQCREHPKPKEQKRRMDSISIGVMEKLISPELAENVRSTFGPRNPLEELASVNKGLTKLIKKQLSECKRFQHFVRLRYEIGNALFTLTLIELHIFKSRMINFDKKEVKIIFKHKLPLCQ